MWLSFVWYWKKAIKIHPFHPLLLNAGWQRQHDKLTISLPVSTLFLCQSPWSRYTRRNEMPSEFWSLSQGRRTFIKPCHTWTQQRVKSLTTVNKMSDNAWDVPLTSKDTSLPLGVAFVRNTTNAPSLLLVTKTPDLENLVLRTHNGHLTITRTRTHTRPWRGPRTCSDL